MQKLSLKHHIWRLILIPVVSVILVLTASLTWLYLHQLNDYVEKRGAGLTQKLAEVSGAALARGEVELIIPLLEASLEEPYIRGIALHLGNGESFHTGASMLSPAEARPLDMSQPQQRVTAQSIRFSHPVTGNAGQTQGWVEAELLTSPFQVVRYQTLLTSLVLLLLGLTFAGGLSLRLHQKIIAPLDNLKQVLANMADGHLDKRLEPQASREFQDLADTVNAMGESLEQAHKDMQIHIDQSTEDLRETLETIEVQNIELNMARKEALEASRIKSEFLANTSHEIRTPLNGILGFTNLALKTRLDEQQREYLLTIRDSSQSLLTVINDILDFSKIEAGKLTLDYAPLPLRLVVEEALHILAPDAHEKHLQLITRIEDRIPPRLLGDPLRLKQVLSNLVSNAIKFSTEGNIVVDVSVVSRQENQVTLKFSVRDNGIGLTSEQKRQLFSAFNQADTSRSREHGGTGLGLVICRGLVERMGGEIGVESEYHQGALFWFTARLGVDKAQPPLEPYPLRDKRVLICGDNEASGEQLQQLLQQWQAKTDQLQNFHDIFPRLREAKNKGDAFALLLMDIAPSEQGITPALLANIHQQIREEFGCALVVCCTPAHQRLFRSHRDWPLTGFVDKPVTHDQLLETLAQHLDLDLTGPSALPVTSEQRRETANIKILVVDDNPANLQLASELLRGLKTSVVPATSGTEALEICARESFDLIFMDIQMPGMDGIETTEALRRQSTPDTRTPIIALTAHSMTEQKAELLVAGLDDCVSKPVSENQLSHIISRWVPLDETGRDKSTNSEPDTEHKVVPATEEPRTPPSAQDARLSSYKEAIEEPGGPVDIPLSLKLANQKPALAHDMLAMLLRNLEAERTEINQAFDDGEYEELEALVHRLYGSCCYCGVPRLKRISGLLDKILQARQYDQLESPITALNNEIEEVLRWGFERDLEALFGLKPQHTDL